MQTDLKVDGCGPASYYPQGYKAMGAALEKSGRPIVYSCSWPAYINGGNESLQPFGTFIMDGCNLWRNWHDIQCYNKSLLSIIDHWGDYGSALAPWAGPGHWHDPDMLLIGNGCISEDEERTQMALWSISAAPLIMGNDPRSISAASKAILMNKDAIDVDQDPLGQMGVRLDATSVPQQRWARKLANGDVAVGLYNRGDASGNGGPADITIAFADVNFPGAVSVYDIWAQQSLGSFTGSYTAKAVPYHGTAFLRLSQA